MLILSNNDGVFRNNILLKKCEFQGNVYGQLHKLFSIMIMINLITCNYKCEKLTGNTVIRLRNNTFVNNDMYESNLI